MSRAAPYLSTKQVPVGCCKLHEFMDSYFGESPSAHILRFNEGEEELQHTFFQAWAVIGQLHYLGDHVFTVLAVRPLDTKDLHDLPDYLSSPEVCRKYEIVEVLTTSSDCVKFIHMWCKCAIALGFLHHNKTFVGDLHEGNIHIAVNQKGDSFELDPCIVDFCGSVTEF